jgi:hypothetical protein
MDLHTGLIKSRTTANIAEMRCRATAAGGLATSYGSRKTLAERAVLVSII